MSAEPALKLMKGIDEYIACGINVVVGILIFLFGCGGFKFFYYWRGEHWWNSWPGFLICSLGGGAVGFFSYIYRHHEFGEYPDSAYAGSSVLLSLGRRLALGLIAAVTIYFVWDIMK